MQVHLHVRQSIKSIDFGLSLGNCTHLLCTVNWRKTNLKIASRQDENKFPFCFKRL